MKRPFILFEDNEDGTTTCTIYEGSDAEEHSFIIPLGFDDMLTFIPGETSISEAQQQILDTMIAIPNKPPE